jgi:hypothetical protein
MKTIVIFIIFISLIHIFLIYEDNERLTKLKSPISINNQIIKDALLVNNFILDNLQILAPSTKNHRQGVPDINTYESENYYYFTNPFLIKKYLGKSTPALERIENALDTIDSSLQINYNYKTKVFWYEIESGAVTNISYKHQLWFKIPPERLDYFKNSHQLLNVEKLDADWTYIICISHEDIDELHCDAHELPSKT